jgi:hypothetical protein
MCHLRPRKGLLLGKCVEMNGGASCQMVDMLRVTSISLSYVFFHNFKSGALRLCGPTLHLHHCHESVAGLPDEHPFAVDTYSLHAIRPGLEFGVVEDEIFH